MYVVFALCKGKYVAICVYPSALGCQQTSKRVPVVNCDGVFSAWRVFFAKPETPSLNYLIIGNNGCEGFDRVAS
jgi:hypothetical protein